MTKRYLISVMAANRVGILTALTNALEELGANLVEVQQNVMQKFFTLMMAADFPDQRTPDVVVDHIRGICRPFGGDVILKDPQIEKLQSETDHESWEGHLSLKGEDKPGTMRRVTARIAQDGVDIVSLHAVRSDDGMYVFNMSLSLPAVVDSNRLEEELSKLVRSVTLSVKHPASPT
ncbi:MAG: ACT domain-containing protein [Planctomycetaceae bacterium]